MVLVYDTSVKKISYFFIKVYIFIAVGYNDFFEEFSMNTKYSSMRKDINFHYFHTVVIKIVTDLYPCISVSIKHEIKSRAIPISVKALFL